jgi:hypothetical protein
MPKLVTATREPGAPRRGGEDQPSKYGEVANVRDLRRLAQLCGCEGSTYWTPLANGALLAK